MTKIIAHRGAWKEFDLPQNSRASLTKAIEIKAYGSEFDVHRTKDDRLVVFHDDEVNGQNIEDLFYHDIKKMTLSNGESVPSLDTFLKIGLAQENTKLIIEIKSSPTSELLTLKTVNLFYELLKTYSYPNHLIEVIMFCWNGAIKIKQLLPQLKVCYLNGDKEVNEIVNVGLDGIDYHYSNLVDPSFIIDQCNKFQKISNAWTVNDWEIANQLIDKKITYITTDYPQLFIKNNKKKN